MSWRSFWKLRSITGHFFANSDYDHEYFFEHFLSFFPKHSRCYLPGSYGDPHAEQSTLVMVRRKLELKLDFRALARSSAEGPSIVAAIGDELCAVIHGPKEKTQQKKTKKNKEVSVWLCKVSTLHHLQTSEFWGACYVATVLHVTVIVYVDVQMQVGQAAARGKRRKSVIVNTFGVDHRGNELECTDLVHWTEALQRFSSRDAIIVAGSVLEKHLDGDFTPDQEKQITVKRWPPGYQSWKLGLALNGLR